MCAPFDLFPQHFCLARIEWKLFFWTKLVKLLGILTEIFLIFVIYGNKHSARTVFILKRLLRTN